MPETDQLAEEEVFEPETGETVFSVDWDDDPALTQEECEALDNSDREEMLTDAEEADAIEAEVKGSRITGTDGKSYPKPELKTPRRPALSDAFWPDTYDLSKRITTVKNLTADDRRGAAAANGSHGGGTQP